MDFEKAYRKTLVKWQRIAAGEFVDPGSKCGLCEWAAAQPGELCPSCPAYRHYMKNVCIDGLADLQYAVQDYEDGAVGRLRRSAQRVVEELLAVKTSLFVEARWIASQKS